MGLDELVDIVDENDNVIGKATRREVHERGLWHRGVHLLLYRSDGRMVLQRRSLKKKHAPGKLDCAVSEHVLAGESYDVAVVRGIEEELGIDASKLSLKPLFKHGLDYGDNDFMIAVVYQGVWDHNFNLHPDEVEEVVVMSVDEVKELLLNNPSEFSRWTEQILRHVFGMASELEVLESYR